MNTKEERKRIEIKTYLATIHPHGQNPFTVIVFESEEKYGKDKRRVVQIDPDEWFGLFKMVLDIRDQKIAEIIKELQAQKESQTEQKSSSEK